MAQPLPLSDSAVHRWFVFSHSYSHTLVEKLIETWGLEPGDRILDPFVGAGTTLVVAKDRGISAVGIDVSPLATLVSKVKVAQYDPDELLEDWRAVRGRLSRRPPRTPPPDSALVRRAFTPSAWRWLLALREAILTVSRQDHREFFQVSYLRAMREVCRAQSDGGWLRWTRSRPSGEDLVQRMDRAVASMVSDIRARPFGERSGSRWEVIQGDARVLPTTLGKVSAVICSPPYPNRHDYSRVFAPELLLTFCDETKLKELRYNSFRSHVEAKVPSHSTEEFVAPPKLARTLRQLAKAPVTDRRVLPMIEGYFQDCFLLLKALRPHLLKGGRLAFVVGNVRHAGVMIEVDEFLGQIAVELGYTREESWVIRFRGNSAQQMGYFGRTPARETVVMLTWE